MITAPSIDSPLAKASQELEKSGFAVINLSPHLRGLERLPSFQNNWDTLVQDPYLPPEFGVRFRRHGRFLYDSDKGSFTPLPDAPYFQSEEVNSVAGGMVRKFAPLEGELMASLIFFDILNCGAKIFPLHQSAKWIVNVHCIRIPCSASVLGYPCPEGIHRDGFEYISIHVVKRKDISDALTYLYDVDGGLLDKRLLGSPLDSVFASDTKVMHFTDTFKPSGNDQGYRDTLLMSYSAERSNPHDRLSPF